jgi:hypothetical protein
LDVSFFDIVVQLGCFNISLCLALVKSKFLQTVLFFLQFSELLFLFLKFTFFFSSQILFQNCKLFLVVFVDFFMSFSGLQVVICITRPFPSEGFSFFAASSFQLSNLIFVDTVYLLKLLVIFLFSLFALFTASFCYFVFKFFNSAIIIITSQGSMA